MELWGLLDNSIEELRYVEGFAIASVNDTIAAIVKSLRNSSRSVDKKLSQFIHREEENLPETESVSEAKELLEEIPSTTDEESPIVIKPEPPIVNDPPTKPQSPVDPPTDPPIDPPITNNPQLPSNPQSPNTNTPNNPGNPYGTLCYNGVELGPAQFNQVSLGGSSQVLVGLSDQLEIFTERAVDYLASKKYFAYNEQSRRINYKNSFQLPYGEDDICVPVSMHIPYARNSELKASPYSEEGENIVREKFGVSGMVSRVIASNNIYQYQSTVGYLPTGLNDVEPQIESWDFIPQDQS